MFRLETLVHAYRYPDSGHTEFIKLWSLLMVVCTVYWSQSNMNGESQISMSMAPLILCIDYNRRGLKKMSNHLKLIAFGNDDKYETKNQICGKSWFEASFVSSSSESYFWRHRVVTWTKVQAFVKFTIRMFTEVFFGVTKICVIFVICHVTYDSTSGVRIQIS